MDIHLMVDSGTISRILDAIVVQKGDRILEIGPGRGALTRGLAKKSPVVAIETENAFCEELERMRLPNVRIVHGNAIRELPHHVAPVLVSNLPYSICEPLFRMLPFLAWRDAYFTLPRGFAELLHKLPYTALFQTTDIFTVPKVVFDPQPRTESVFVHCTPASPSFLRDVFMQQRAKVGNAMMNSLCTRGSTKRAAREALKSLSPQLSDKLVRTLSVGECTEIEKFSQTLNTGERQ